MTKTTELNRRYNHNGTVTYYESKETGYTISIERIKNDVNGNPMYKAIFNKEHMANKTNPHVVRRYLSKGYVLIQSANIEWDVIDIMNYIEKGGE